MANIPSSVKGWSIPKDDLEEKARILGEKTLQLLLGLMLGEDGVKEISIADRTYKIEAFRNRNLIQISPIDQ
jgi:hypothetical protein